MKIKKPFSCHRSSQSLFIRYCTIIIFLFVSGVYAAVTKVLTPPLEINGNCIFGDLLISHGKDAKIVDRGITSVKGTYGIKGDPENGKSTIGEMWLSVLTGNTVTSNVKLGATLEANRDSPYRFMINDNVIYGGNYPFKKTKKTVAMQHYRIGS